MLVGNMNNIIVFKAIFLKQPQESIPGFAIRMPAFIPLLIPKHAELRLNQVKTEFHIFRRKL